MMIDPRTQYLAGALPPDDDDTAELRDLLRQRFYRLRATHDAPDAREGMDD